MADDREDFPSKRQRGCAGLQLKYYPDYVRDMVDVDYAGKLSEADRIWLASFLEEHYRGWRLKRETQVHPIGLIRESARAHDKRRRGFERVQFVSHQDDTDGTTEDAVIDTLDTKRRLNGR